MKHLEDLDIDDFLTLMDNFDRCLFSEKIDGVNLQAGKNKQGFFTERKLKGGKKYWSPYDYPAEESYDAFSSAHFLFRYCMRQYDSFYDFKDGDLIDLEIIYGSQPNVIQYDSGINRVIFLRQLEGTRTYDEKIINFRDKVIEIPPLRLFYDKPTKWKFELVPPIPYNDMLNIRYSDKVNQILDELKEYLDRKFEGMTYREIANLNLSHKLPIDKEKAKVKREEIRNKLYDYKMRAKNEFLPYLKTIVSNFSKQEAGIEGIVISYKDIITKIIDKNHFTEINKFIWKVREQIRDEYMIPLDISLAAKMGHPLLGYQAQRKRYIQKLEKETGLTGPEIFYKTGYIPFNELYKEVLEVYDKLKEFQERYKSEYKTYVLELDKTYTYNEAVHGKTLIYFSDSFKKLNNYIDFIEDKDKVNFLCLLSNYGEGK